MNSLSRFEIHERLVSDTHALGRLALCHVLLHRNATIPWLILVPEVESIELHEVPEAQRQTLYGECDATALVVKEHFGVDKLNVAAIGTSIYRDRWGRKGSFDGRGSVIGHQAGKLGNMVACCDVNRVHAANFAARYDGRCQIYSDYRKLLERKDIDAVTIGTPDHWHTEIAIAACRAPRGVVTTLSPRPTPCPAASTPKAPDWRPAEFLRSLACELNSLSPSFPPSASWSEQGVRLAQKTQVGPCIPARIQL